MAAASMATASMATAMGIHFCSRQQAGDDRA
jgi:hypothetical protein